MILAITVSLNLTIFLEKLNKKTLFIVVALLLILILPRWVYSVNQNFNLDYLSGYHGINNVELNVYSFLKNDTPKNSEVLLLDQPIYMYYSSIVSVLAERNLFFSGIGVSQIITPEYTRREKDVALVKNSKDDKKVIQTLKSDSINYLVIYNDTPIATNSPLLKNKFLEKVFSNKSAKVFKVN
jgi:hypothetical protein